MKLRVVIIGWMLVFGVLGCDEQNYSGSASSSVTSDSSGSNASSADSNATSNDATTGNNGTSASNATSNGATTGNNATTYPSNGSTSASNATTTGNGTTGETTNPVGTPQIRLEPDLLDFGDVLTSTSVVEEIQVRNMGDGLLMLESVEMLQGTDERFSIIDPPTQPIVIPAGESHPVQLSFTAFGSTSASGTAVFLSNDPTSLQTPLPLTARLAAPNIAVSPEAIHFGAVGLAIATEQRLVISNRGTVPLEIEPMTIAGDFSIVPNPDFPPTTGGVGLIAPGMRAEVLIRFIPSVLGQRRATLNLFSNDPDQEQLAIALTGVGRDSTECIVTVGPDPVNFGVVASNTSASLSVTIHNAGTGICQFNGVTAAGILNNRFSIDNSPPPQTHIPAGQSATVTVNYLTTNLDLNKGRLDLDISDPNNAQSRVLCNAGLRCVENPNDFECNNPLIWGFQDPTAPLCGARLNGLAGNVDLAAIPTQVNFGAVALGCAERATVALYSAGIVLANIIDITLVGCSAVEIDQEEDFPIMLPLDAPFELPLIYHPERLGAEQCALRIDYLSDQSQPDTRASLEIALYGEGVELGLQRDQFTQGAVDILLAVDTSGSMTEELEAVGEALEHLLPTDAQGEIDLHIGVVHIDLEEPFERGGRLYEAGELMGDQSFITHETRDPIGVLWSQMTASGGSREAGLEAALRAISDPLTAGHNAGFLRGGAALDIIIVSNEDDMSRLGVGFYSHAFAHASARVSIIGGVDVNTNDPIGCSSQSSDAEASPRYVAVVRETGGLARSICAQELDIHIRTLRDLSFSPRHRFPLSRTPEPNSVHVSLDGVEANSADWTYNAMDNALLFDADAPPFGVIEVEYQPLCEQ